MGTADTADSRPRGRVLLLGEQVAGLRGLFVHSDYYDVHMRRDVVDIADLDLRGYDITIVDYDAFRLEGDYLREPQDLFDARVLSTLKAGNWVCFTCFDEGVPGSRASNTHIGQMDEVDYAQAQMRQIGFRWLSRLEVRPLRPGNLILSGRTVRGEFRDYFDRWGSSYLVFRPYGAGKFDDVLLGTNVPKFAKAFACRHSDGMLLYLPLHTDRSRTADLSDALVSLVGALATYRSKIRRALPNWLSDPLFGDEREVLGHVAGLKEDLAALEAKLGVYEDAKRLLGLAEYDLQAALPAFLADQCGLSTRQHEEYKEDFWLLSETGEDSAICEVKSYSKGDRKECVYSVYKHRDSRGLEESFPAVVFCNPHMNATSLNDKSRPIDAAVIAAASSNSVLVVRVLDVVYAWNAIRTGSLIAQDFNRLLHNEHGWLEFLPSGNHKVHSH